MKNKDFDIRLNFAKRIGGSSFGCDDDLQKSKKNKFVKITEAKIQAMKDNPNTELIDFGVGDADDVADTIVRDELKYQVDLFENRGYPDNGIFEFKDACARFMRSQFGVRLDPHTQINHCIGAKSALSILPLALLDEGDTVIMTSPGYPIFGTNAGYLGANVYKAPLTKQNGFMPNFDDIPNDVLDKAKVMVLNYPNSPTGAVVTEDFYLKAIDVAKKYNIVIVQDAAYSRIVYDSKPLSFLSVGGAMDVGVEVHSMSKLFNMTGWRLGFVAGNELLVKAFAMLKDNVDCGQFKAIQMAGVKALDTPSITDKLVEKFGRRLRKIVEILNEKGFDATMSGGSYFLYVEIPKGVKGGVSFNNAEEFSEWLVRNKLISTVPWDDAGHFVRLSATFLAKDMEDEIRVFEDFRNRLKDVEFLF